VIRGFTSSCRGLLALAVSLGVSWPAFAAEPQYGFERFTVEDGLPQNIVRGIAQTPDGYLWIATLDGLARFDGVRFVLFEKNNTPGLVSNRFREMHAGRGGDLWLTNEIGGVTRYHDGVFRSYGMDRGIPISEVSALTVSESGDVWILSANRILQWDEAGGSLSP
jgi:ligand-binding sensor domain-containing protein